MVAVASHDVVIFAKCSHRTHPHRFLPNVQVAKPTDPALCVRLARPLLEVANPKHLTQQLTIEVAAFGIELDRKGDRHPRCSLAP